MQDHRLELLKVKMDRLFDVQAIWEAQGKDFNASIQGGREYRNPRICEKLIEAFRIEQYGTNFSKEDIVQSPHGSKRRKMDNNPNPRG